MMRLRYGEDFAGATQAVRLRREAEARDDVEVSFHPAGHVLGSAQICVAANGTRIVASGDYKDVAGPDLRAVRADAVRCVHHRGDVRPAGVPAWRPERRDRQAAALGRAVSRARASGRRLFARQGAARDRADPRGRLRQADLSARRDGEHHALLRLARHRSRRIAPRARRDEGRACRRDRDLPALGAAGPLDAALSRSGLGVRVRLDARARARAPARRRTAAGDLRSCRLGRPYRHHRGDRRVAGLGHARRRGGAGALVHAAGARGAAAEYRGVWG